MTSQAKSTKQEAKPAIVLFGLGEGDKPRAAYFDEIQAEGALKLADSMNLKVLKVTNDEQASLAVKLPPGKLYMSGKGFVPFVRQELYARVSELAANTASPESERTADAPAVLAENEGAEAQQKADNGSGSQAQAETGGKVASPNQQDGGRGTPEHQPPIKGFPSSWDDIEVGHLVIAQESAEDGWWEAIVLEKEQDLFTLRWRDFLKFPKFVRHRSSLALMCPTVR